MPDMPDFNPNKADPVSGVNDNLDSEQILDENDPSQQPEHNSNSTNELVDQVNDLRNAVKDWKSPVSSNPITTTGSEELSARGASTLVDAAGSSGVGTSAVGSVEAASLSAASEVSMVGSAGAAVAADTTLLGSAAMSTGAVVGAVGAETAAVGASAVVGIAGAEVAGAAGLSVAAAEAATGIGIPLAVITAAITLAPTAFNWIKEHYIIVCVLILISNIPFILLAVAIASSLRTFGNLQGGIPVTESNLSTAGGGCTSMTDQLIYSNNGKGIALTLSSTKGRWSAEDAAIAPGHLVTVTDPKKGNLSFASSKFSTQDLKWYVTSRWPYASWAWSGKSISHKGGPPSGQYAGKKIVIYDTNTKLTAVGIIAESGPAPHTGTDHSIVKGEWKEDSAKGAQQEQLWGDQYRSVDPSGYDGNVVGGPKYEGSNTNGSISDGIGAALKAKVGDEMIYGFAKDQTIPLGPSSCSPIVKTVSMGTNSATDVVGVDVSNDSAKDNDGAPHFVPNVPAVRQADGTDCNKASAAMVILHYDPKITGFTEVAKGHLVNTESSSCYANTSTALEKALGPKNIKFNELPRSQVSINLFKQSIDAGDPVIIRQTGLISSGVHFVVLVGYDNSHFYFNDPFPWGGSESDTSLGVEHVYTVRGHNSPHPLITQSTLMSALTGNYVAIVRKH